VALLLSAESPLYVKEREEIVGKKIGNFGSGVF
jgi:hypothetical protein